MKSMIWSRSPKNIRMTCYQLGNAPTFFFNMPYFSKAFPPYKVYTMDFCLHYMNLPEAEKKFYCEGLQTVLKQISFELPGYINFSVLNINFETFTSKIYITNVRYKQELYTIHINRKEDLIDLFRRKAECLLNIPD